MNVLSGKVYSERHKRRKLTQHVKTQLIAIAATTPINPVQCKIKNFELSDFQNNNRQNCDDFVKEDDCDIAKIVSEAENILEERAFDNHTETDKDNYQSSSDEAKYGTIVCSESFQEFLSGWSVQHKIPSSALTELLKKLRQHHGFESLPNDARTFLKTPRCSQIISIPPGQYIHFGLKANLCRILEVTTRRDVFSDGLKLQINIDGIPIFKSTNDQFWPILGFVKHSEVSPFPVGIYLGKAKPYCVNECLQQFVEELLELQRVGIHYKNSHYKIIIDSFICDTPARSFVMCIKGHNGYNPCSKCKITGEYIGKKVVLQSVDNTRRTNESFCQQQDKNHHIGRSILEKLDFDIVRCFPFEFMHSVCLGISRKLLHLWLKSKPSKFKISCRQADIISTRLCSFPLFTPKEFARKPRSLVDLDRWKASELRQFLLYSGPVVLKSVIESKYYDHVLTLHVAIRILCSKSLYLQLNEYAHSLLKYFIQQFASLYGTENVTYNLHAIEHIAEDCKYLGTLDEFSGFKFENYLGYLKSLLRKPNSPLQQIHRRIIEKQNIGEPAIKLPKLKPSVQILPPDCTPPQTLNYIFQNFEISSKVGNNICMLQDGTVICVACFAYKDNLHVVVGKKYCKRSAFYQSPCDSTKLFLYKVCQLSDFLSCWPSREIKYKCVGYPLNDYFIIFPCLF